MEEVPKNHKPFITTQILKKAANDKSIELSKFIKELAIDQMNEQQMNMLRQCTWQLDENNLRERSLQCRIAAAIGISRSQRSRLRGQQKAKQLKSQSKINQMTTDKLREVANDDTIAIELSKFIKELAIDQMDQKQINFLQQSAQKLDDEKISEFVLKHLIIATIEFQRNHLNRILIQKNKPKNLSKFPQFTTQRLQEAANDDSQCLFRYIQGLKTDKMDEEQIIFLQQSALKLDSSKRRHLQLKNMIICSITYRRGCLRRLKQQQIQRSHQQKIPKITTQRLKEVAHDQKIEFSRFLEELAIDRMNQQQINMLRKCAWQLDNNNQRERRLHYKIVGAIGICNGKRKHILRQQKLNQFNESKFRNSKSKSICSVVHQSTLSKFNSIKGKIQSTISSWIPKFLTQNPKPTQKQDSDQQQQEQLISEKQNNNRLKKQNQKTNC